MFISDMIAALIAQLVQNGNIRVTLDRVSHYSTEISGFYCYTDMETGDKYLLVVPVDH